MWLYTQIYQRKLTQIRHVGRVLKTSGLADSKFIPGIDNWTRYIGITKQNKISNCNENYCI